MKREITEKFEILINDYKWICHWKFQVSTSFLFKFQSSLYQ